MKKLLFFLILASFSILLAFGSSSDCEHTKTAFKCVEYVRNYDADTITFNIPNVHPLIGEKISIRVAGVDAPEMNSKSTCEKETSRNAKRLVANLMKNAKKIDLLNVEKDKYFRILADVSIDGKDLKALLLKNHLAYEYHGGTKEKRNWCLAGKSQEAVSRILATEKK